MLVDNSDILRCELRLGQVRQNSKKRGQYVTNADTSFNDEDFVFSNLRDYSEKDSNIDDRFIQVFDENGSTKTVLKSSLVWVLTETKGVLSNDRLRRVQGQSEYPTKRKNITRKDVEISPKVATKRSKHLIRVEEKIEVGNWCVFKRYGKKETNPQKDIVYGAVLAFKYIDGNNEKEKQFTMDFASIPNDRGIEALATWYKCEENNTLQPSSENNNFFIDIKNYIATIDAPNQIQNQFLFENQDEIKKFVSSFNKV